MENTTAGLSVNEAERIAGPSRPSSAKISCLACRAAKRKCHTPDAQTTCRRCVTHHLVCEYKKHHRGRRKKESSNAPRTSPFQSIVEPGGLVDNVSNTARSESMASVVDAGQTTAYNDRMDIHFSHLVPVDGDSSPYLPRGFPPPRSTPLELLLRSDCPDPVMAGVLSESEALDLFDFYFRHLNITVAILDPFLHTAHSCRERSPLLFTAVLTVTSRIRRPKAYSHCLLLANKLIGQTMEHGLCSLDIVQALNLMTHWKKADDGTSWRRVGYAVRMAQELKLHERTPRPLPSNETRAREILNGERAWLNLVVADYHLAIHHSLPRMIAEDGIDDPSDWLNDHLHLSCPGESSLGPMITFSRLCRLYADILEGMTDNASSLRQLKWCESEWKRWRNRWLVRSREHNFLQLQISTFKACDAYFRFHIAEARLLFHTRYRSDHSLSAEAASEGLPFAFRDCVESALALAETFQKEFVQRGYLPFSFNLVWVGLAVTAVWLIKNIVPMDLEDRARVIRILSEIHSSTEEASCSSDDMAAYTHRVLKHLLGGIPPEWQFSSIIDKRRASLPAPESLVGSTSPLNAGGWNVPSTQPLPQDDMWGQHSGASFDVGNALLSLHTPSDLATVPDIQGLPADMLFPAVDDDFWKSLFPPTGGGLL